MVALAVTVAAATLTFSAAILAFGAEKPAPFLGNVKDASGQPIAGAEVVLSELGREATTANDGSFQFEDVPAGRYTVVVRRVGYASDAEIVTLPASNALDLTLDATPILVDPVTITATRSALKTERSPLPASSLSGEAIRTETSVSISHAVDQLAGVHTVSTGEEIGKPVIRGLTGSRVLVLDAGHRLEDYSWSDEDGPSVEPSSAERIELIRGPASLLYGSDALGGVINVIPRELPEAEDGPSVRRGWVQAYGALNNHEIGGGLTVEGAKHDLGWRLSGIGRFAEAIHTPDGELENTGFASFNGDAAVGLHGTSGSSQLRVAHYAGEFKLLEANGPPPGQEEGEEEGPERKASDDRVQLSGNALWGGLRLEGKAQFQRHSLIEVSDDTVGVTPALSRALDTAAKKKESEAFNLLLNTASVDLLVHHLDGANLRGTVGLSGMTQKNDSKGPIFFVPDATISSGAAFALEEATVGKLSVVAGARIDSRKLSSDANSQVGNPSEDRTNSEASGDFGLTYEATELISLSANLGRAWRAPTLFELYANGQHIGEARYEKGDASIDPEHGTNVDLGVRLHSRCVQLQLAGFSNKVQDYIYLNPTNDHIGGLRVYRYQQADAKLEGGECSIEAQVLDPLTVHGRLDYVKGTNDDTDKPLPLVPPLRSELGARYYFHDGSFAKHPFAGVSVQFNAKQVLRSEFDLPSGEYTLVGVEAGLEHELFGRPVQFDLRAENVGNRRYRSYLSRYKEFADNPGLDAVLKLSTHL